MLLLNKKKRYLENASPRIPGESLCILKTLARNPLSPGIVTFPGTTFLSGPDTNTDHSSTRKTRAVNSSQRTRSKSESAEARQTSPTRQAPPIEIYTAYVESERNFFERRIATFYGILKRQNYHVSCHEDEVTDNFVWQQHNHLETARLIILLVSPDFLNTDFCYHEQMRTAVKRHYQRRCHLIPLLVCPTPLEFLQKTPFGNLRFLPGRDQPVPHEEGPQKQVFYDICNEILDKLRDLAYHS